MQKVAASVPADASVQL